MNIRQLVNVSVILLQNVSLPLRAAEPQAPVAGLDGAFQALAVWLPVGARSHVEVTTPTETLKASVDSKRLHEATETSAAWIRATLKREFVPEKLESQIEGIPGGLAGWDRGGGLGNWPRFDCTRAMFEARGYRFLIIQDSTAISVFVSPSTPENQGPRGTAEEIVQTFRRWMKDLFQHSEIALYLSPIRVTDYGVDMPRLLEVWDARDNQWRPTVAAPPKAWEEGLLPVYGRPDRDAMAKRIGGIDPTINEGFRRDFQRQWWGNVYAATDGRALFYIAPKLTGGQAMYTVEVPDWFRNLDESEQITGTGEKAEETRARIVPGPPNH